MFTFLTVIFAIIGIVMLLMLANILSLTMNEKKLKRDKKAGFNDLLNYASIIEDGIILGKDGSLSASYIYQCDDSDSSTAADCDLLAHHINALLLQFGNGWVMHIDCIRKGVENYEHASLSKFPDVITRAIDEERRRFFNSLGNMFESEYIITFTYLPPLLMQQKFVNLMFTDGTKQKKQKDIDLTSKILKQFKAKLSAIESHLSSYIKLTRLCSETIEQEDNSTIKYDNQLSFINYCINGNYDKLRIPDNPMFLDCLLATNDFVAGTIPSIGKQYIQCVSIENFPANSYTGILNELSKLSCPFRWNTRYIFLDQYQSVNVITKYQKKWKQKVRGIIAQLFDTNSNIDFSALEMQEDADSMLTAVNGNYVGCGYYTSVIVLMSDDREELDLNARYIQKAIVNNCGFSARIESLNNVEAYLGSLPTNATCNIRQPLIQTLNLAHLIPTSSIWTGQKHCPCPFYPNNETTPPLMHCVTDGSSPFRFNIHVGDLGHTLILGPTGAGKSTLLATIAAQLRRYENMSIYAFDKGMSMYALCKACKGSHYEIAQEDSSLKFNPFQYIDTFEDRAWLSDWVQAILKLNNVNNTGNLTSDQVIEINTTLEFMYKNKNVTVPTFSAFWSIIQDLEIRNILMSYIGDSLMGLILDGEVDNLNFSNFTVFEMEEIMNHSDKNRIPILLYLFKRIQDGLKGQPAVIILDEAWIMLSNPVFREKIREWLKVLRKANCAVIMATQSISDAVNSGIMDVINESCPTKIFLPNSTAAQEDTREMYKSLGLNSRQIDIIARAIPKRDYYFVSRVGRRLFSLALGKLTLAFVAVSDKEAIAEIKELESQYGDNWIYPYLENKNIDIKDYSND